MTRAHGMLAVLLLAVWPASAAEFARESRWQKLYKISVAAVVASAAADMGTSMRPHLYESNPLLAGSDGRFGARGVALKSAIVGGTLAAGYIFHRRHPAISAAANAGMAAVTGVTAIHNARLK